MIDKAVVTPAAACDSSDFSKIANHHHADDVSNPRINDNVGIFIPLQCQNLHRCQAFMCKFFSLF